jgi:hypothetical protein
MNILVVEAHALLEDLAAGQHRPLERDQSADTKRKRDRKVARITAALRAAGMSQKANAVAMYHDHVDRFVDGQQAVDPTRIGSAMRDPGVWLTRIYDHARRVE